MHERWLEIGDRAWVRRYACYDQNIVAIRGGDQALVVDTRATLGQARELLRDLDEIGIDRVDVVVNTHGHHDHAFGNGVFRAREVWGHERCATMLRTTGEAQRAAAAVESPELAAELAQVVIHPPDRLFRDRAVLDLGGRTIDLHYLGRGHTDNDIVVLVPDTALLCAGDLLENGTAPSFGDSYPLEWPKAVERLLAMTDGATVVVPGHGDHAGRAFVERSLDELREVAELAATVHVGHRTLEDAITAGPYAPELMREPLERTLAQLRGDLGA
jgi:glyoxylase-like metal-dependent hydrolase (beta-lactamase superfamily II)